MNSMKWMCRCRRDVIYTSQRMFSSQDKRVVPLHFEKIRECDEVTSRPLVILHGLFGSSKNWMSLARAFSKHMRREVYAIDLRNHGSSTHADAIDYRLMSLDVSALLEQEGIGRKSQPTIDLMGHSMGGKVAMMLALSLDLPEIISKLVVVDTAPEHTRRLNETQFGRYLPAMQSVTMNHRLTMSQVRQNVAAQLEPVIKDKGELGFLLTNIVKREDGNYSWKFNLDSIAENIHSLVSFPRLGTQFTKPTIFIGGFNSKHITAGNKFDIDRLFPSAEITYVDNAGHWLHVEKPKEFMAIVTDFLEHYSES